ncbi:MAG: hypothetical protein HY796_07190, partial [Elusimicrobia bacterium]|nr:hypothetical protein [Elusimicrobiota bacterium]
KEELVASLNCERAKRQEECARLELELAGKKSDFKSLLNKEREEYRADYDRMEKDFTARKTALAAGLQSLKEAAGRREAELAGEIKELEQARERDVRALELELKNKTQVLAGVQSELYKRQEERERDELELAEKSAEFKSVLGRVREAYRAERDILEKEFSARERALITELHNVKETAGRRETELARQNLEMKAVRDKYEAGAKELKSSRDKIIELKKLKDGAGKFPDEIKKMKALESALSGKEQLIASLNSERVKHRQECERLELELAGIEADFKSLLSREREAYRAERDILEKEFKTREEALRSELAGLRKGETGSRAEIN